MTYKESLEQAFLKTDSEEADYESGIFPILANEAQLYIAKYGTHIVRKAEYNVTDAPYRADLPSDFYRAAPLGLVYADDETIGADYYMAEDGKMVIKQPGEYVLYYWALPKDLTSSDVDLETYEYEVAKHTHAAIASYIGYQLVKTDDVQLAQILKNEWDRYMSLFDDSTKAVQKKIKNIVRW